MFGGWLRPKEAPYEAEAASLYAAVVAQAREPAFYARGGVPDTVDGRFEMIVLHAYALLRRLKDDQEGGELGQKLFDLLFLDMDRSLREMGAGDLGVGKRVKVMIQAFYGRLTAYDSGLEGGLESGPAALEAALARNLYGTQAARPAQVTAMAAYLHDLVAALEGQDLAGLRAGRVVFPPPPDFPQD